MKNTIIIPEPSLRRLPLYHQVLKKLKTDGLEYVSATHIAKELQLVPIQVRKDLNYTGITGSPKKGYLLKELAHKLEDFLGWNHINEAFLVGAGNLGTALLGYDGFKNLGFDIVAAFDSSVRRHGREMYGVKILPIDDFEDLVKRMKIEIGIITTPWETAQEICDMMVNSGIKAIWNFAPIKLKVPEEIIVQDENLAASLAVLSKKLEMCEDF